MGIERPTRRGFIAGLGSLFIAAPAIVRFASIMPVHAFDEVPLFGTQFGWQHDDALYSELAAITRRAFMPRIYTQIYKATPMLELLTRQGRAVI